MSTNDTNQENTDNKIGKAAPSGGQYSAFFFATFFYFAARIMIGDGGKWDSILLGGYVLLVIIYEFNMALKHTKERCGSPRFTLAFYYVVLPWLIVFGTLNAMLILSSLLSFGVTSCSNHVGKNSSNPGSGNIC